MERVIEVVEALEPTRQRLIKAKVGRLLNWTRPEIVRTVGPYAPEVFERFENGLREVVAKCCESLTAFTDDQIAEILKGPTEGGAIARRWTDFLSNDLHYMERRLPEWHAGGFGHPDHVADFKYWAKMPMFDIGELTCLSVGISPAEFSIQKLEGLCESRDRPKFSVAIEFLVFRFELLKRTFDPHSRDARTSPHSFLSWVDHFEEDVHPGFLEQLRSFHMNEKPAANASTAEKPDKREIDTIAQLFTAMAIDHLGYNPRAAKSLAPKEISDLAASFGIHVTDETVRKYLRLGAKFIADDWVPPER